MKLSSRSVALFLAALTAAPFSSASFAESTLRFVAPAAGTARFQSDRAGSSVRFHTLTQDDSDEVVAAPLPPMRRAVASSLFSSRRGASSAPVHATASPRVAAAPVSLSPSAAPHRLPITQRRSLFLLAFRQRPTEQGAEVDLSDLPRNDLPLAPNTDVATPADELPTNSVPSSPSGPAEANENRPVLRRGEAPRNDVPSNEVPPNSLPGTEADETPPDASGAVEQPDEPRWLFLDQSETTAPLPAREPAVQDGHNSPPSPHEMPIDEYAYAPLPKPLPAVVGPRVGYEPLYAGDPWASYAHECEAGGHGGLLGWLFSLLGLSSH